MKVPRRSAMTKRTSRNTFKWWEMVGWPSRKWSVMSQTQTGSSLAARRLRMRMRVGSARALNQLAYVSASGSSIVGVPGGVQHGSSSMAMVGRSSVVDTSNSFVHRHPNHSIDHCQWINRRRSIIVVRATDDFRDLGQAHLPEHERARMKACVFSSRSPSLSIDERLVLI